MTTRTRRTRRTRRTAALAAAATVASLAGLAAPASAADTLVTFTVAETVGPLSISAPGTAALGEGAQGMRLNGALGTVTVKDQRGALIGGWSATAQATKAVRSGGGGEIPATGISYTTGPATSNPVTLTLNTSTASKALGGALPLPAVTSVGVGHSTATWSPTVAVDVPAGTPAGTYGFTLTHSVS